MDNLCASSILGPVAVYKEEHQVLCIFDVQVNVVAVQYSDMYSSYKSPNKLRPIIKDSAVQLWNDLKKQLSVISYTCII